MIAVCLFGGAMLFVGFICGMKFGTWLCTVDMDDTGELFQR
jgi:hypothetical protein